MSDTMDAPTPADLGDGTVAVNKDGTVRKKPGPKPGTRKPAARAKAPGVRAPVAPTKAPELDFRSAIVGLLQIPQALIGIGARFVKNEQTKTALILDGMTIGVHSGNIANALNTTAQTEESLAKLLDKLSTVGPYSLVIMAVMTPTLQILANHGAIAPNPQMGVLPPEDLVARAQAMAG